MKIPLKIFQGIGIELEYMIVDKNNLKVRPISDEVFLFLTGDYEDEIPADDITIVNELVTHVVEFKTTGPIKNPKESHSGFQEKINNFNTTLENFNAKLLPTGSHPFMDPLTETRLWNHETNIIYETYNRIFSCTGHGWANLQSTHINFPFSGDEEFMKLHAAIRVILPILPALTASTPILENSITGKKDTRLHNYFSNQKKIPSITGKVIPEPCFSKNEYEEKILNKIYKDIAEYDPEKIMQFEWLNSRGAIARFERDTIEIRLIDSQECVKAELAICYAVENVLKALCNTSKFDMDELKSWGENELSGILFKTICDAENTHIDDRKYLSMFCFPSSHCIASELWQHILEESNYSKAIPEIYFNTVKTILQKGSLASRILNKSNGGVSNKNILNNYHQLSECLKYDELFV